MVTFSPEQFRQIQLGIKYGAYVKDSGTEQQLYAARDLGRQIEARLQAVGGDTGWTLEELERAETPATVPESATIGFDNITDKSVLVFWNPHSDGGSAIIGYHLVIKNEDTGQTITESNTSSNVTNTLLQNLDSGTNYKAYVIVINAIGNSFEQSNGFKTLGVKVEPEPEPEPIPITISTEVQAILTKFDNNDYTFPSWFNSNIGYVKDGSLTSNEFLAAFNNLLQAGTIIDTTIPVEKLYDVNTYRINEFGVISNQIIYQVTGLEMLELEKLYLVTISGRPTPSDQEIKDFYNYKDVDTSVEPTMVEARFLEFKIVNEYVEGKINFVATKYFTDYWKDRVIYAHFKVKDSNGLVIPIGDEPKQATKVNDLKFLLDNIETISYREYIGNIQAVTLEVYVWDITQKQLLNGRNIQAFSYPKTEQVVLDDGESCPTGYHLDFNGKCIPDGGKEKDVGSSLLGKVMGVTALIGTLALLGSKRR